VFGKSRRDLQLISEILDDITLAGSPANAEIGGIRKYGYTRVLARFSG